jgi:orotidine-5'-phosphate decarboxylase
LKAAFGRGLVMRRKIICALDTSDKEEAVRLVQRVKPYAAAFKIGHALTLNYGLDIVDMLHDAGAERIFLDLKFHDIPNSVALAVREAARRRVWMMTLHLSGGPAMITAAVEEARIYPEIERPCLVGVSVLTSIDQHVLTDHLGVARRLDDHMMAMSKLGTDLGLDGVVCSPEEITKIRSVIGTGIIVAPGIRAASGELHDQRRVSDAATALALGADYLVIGRALTGKRPPEEALQELGLDFSPA